MRRCARATSPCAWPSRRTWPPPSRRRLPGATFACGARTTTTPPWPPGPSGSTPGAGARPTCSSSTRTKARAPRWRPSSARWSAASPADPLSARSCENLASIAPGVTVTYMARAIAGATISFGLVSIPVKLYSATQPSAGVSFNLLHAKCGSRVKQQYICPRDNELVPREDMIKGYEISKDQYVTFTPEELKSLEERATETIDIAQFVPLASVDPVYFDRPYYLGPEKGGEKAYTLLAEAMRESGRAALARYAARGKQYLVMVRPLTGLGGTAEAKGGLVLQQLL